jgi:hypothetical protein
MASRTGDDGKKIVLDWDDVEEELPPLEYIIRNLGLVGGAGAPHMIAGYGFSGKTMALQSAAISLCVGRAVWGTHPCEPIRVLHVDLEQGERLTRYRYQRLARAMARVDKAMMREHFGLICMPPGLALTNACRSQWRDLMTERDFIFIDSLRAAMPGHDENDSGIRSGLDLLGNLSEETGCRPLVVHHARKGRDDEADGDARFVIRGSSALFDGCDSVYVFSGRDKEPVKCTHVKARSHGETVEEFYLTISDVDGKKGLRVRVDGIDHLEQSREVTAGEVSEARASRDAAKLQEALLAAPEGLGARELRASAKLNGVRFAAALGNLGELVQAKPMVSPQGRTLKYILVVQRNIAE